MSGLHGQATNAAVMKVTAFMRRPKDRKWWKIISMSLPFWSAGGFVSIIPTPFGLKMPLGPAEEGARWSRWRRWRCWAVAAADLQRSSRRGGPSEAHREGETSLSRGRLRLLRARVVRGSPRGCMQGGGATVGGSGGTDAMRLLARKSDTYAMPKSSDCRPTCARARRTARTRASAQRCEPPRSLRRAWASSAQRSRASAGIPRCRVDPASRCSACRARRAVQACCFTARNLRDGPTASSGSTTPRAAVSRTSTASTACRSRGSGRLLRPDAGRAGRRSRSSRRSPAPRRVAESGICSRRR